MKLRIGLDTNLLSIEIQVRKISSLNPDKYKALELEDALKKYDQYITSVIKTSKNKADALFFKSFQDWLDTEI